jgi:hypothetical protein
LLYVRDLEFRISSNLKKVFKFVSLELCWDCKTSRIFLQQSGKSNKKIYELSYVLACPALGASSLPQGCALSLI